MSLFKKGENYSFPQNIWLANQTIDMNTLYRTTRFLSISFDKLYFILIPNHWHSTTELNDDPGGWWTCSTTNKLHFVPMSTKCLTLSSDVHICPKTEATLGPICALHVSRLYRGLPLSVHIRTRCALTMLWWLMMFDFSVRRRKRTPFGRTQQ